MPDMAAPSFLVINVTRIGDTLLATPALRAIAHAYPGSEITCLGHPKRVEVLEHLPFVHQAGGITKQRAVWRGRLGGKRWDYALVYGNDQALARYALRVADKAVAFRQSDEALNQRLYRAVERPAPNALHAVDLQLLLPAALGIAPDGRYLSYCVSDAEANWAQELLRNETPANVKRYVGLQVASFPTKAYRDWPLASFTALCEKIRASYPQSHFLVFGAASERGKGEALRAHFPGEVTVFSGHLSLRQTTAVMQRLALYIGVDTGPTHLAGALGIPLVAMYHCLHRARVYAPLEHTRLYAVDHPAPDGACSETSNMGDISVATLWDKVQAALEKNE